MLLLEHIQNVLWKRFSLRDNENCHKKLHTVVIREFLEKDLNMFVVVQKKKKFEEVFVSQGMYPCQVLTWSLVKPGLEHPIVWLSSWYIACNW